MICHAEKPVLQLNWRDLGPDTPPAQPSHRTTIDTAIDWARIDRSDETPERTPARLSILTLRRNRPEYDSVAIRDARTRVEDHAHFATLATHWLDDDIRGYRTFGYLVAADNGQHDRTPRPIPDLFWHTATYDADYATLTKVGVNTHMRGHFGTDVDLTRKGRRGRRTGGDEEPHCPARRAWQFGGCRSLVPQGSRRQRTRGHAQPAVLLGERDHSTDTETYRSELFFAPSGCQLLN